MRLLTTLTLLTICLTAIGQTFSEKKALTFYPGRFDTESRYTDSTGIAVIIQNGFPEGLGYTDPTGKNFGYRIFWTRVINETASPLELTINFPGDSFAIFPQAGAYLKLFLPPDTMTLHKQWDFDFGATGLKSFLDTAFSKPTMLQRTINPKEECLFYITALFYPRGGFVRAGLEQDPFL
mgnify:FL=1